MKWNRWIIKAAKIITKFTELGYWMTAALMLTAGIYSFADRHISRGRSGGIDPYRSIGAQRPRL